MPKITEIARSPTNEKKAWCLSYTHGSWSHIAFAVLVLFSYTIDAVTTCIDWLLYLSLPNSQVQRHVQSVGKVWDQIPDVWHVTSSCVRAAQRDIDWTIQSMSLDTCRLVLHHQRVKIWTLSAQTMREIHFRYYSCLCKSINSKMYSRSSQLSW